MFQMILSFIVLVFSVTQGLYMLINGLYKLATDSYIIGGLGGWTYDFWWYMVKPFELFDKWELVFIIYGVIWLAVSVLYVFKKVPGRVLIMFMCLFSLWNILWGALLAVIIFILNFFVGNESIINFIMRNFTKSNSS